MAPNAQGSFKKRTVPHMVNTYSHWRHCCHVEVVQTLTVEGDAESLCVNSPGTDHSTGGQTDHSRDSQMGHS